MAGWLTFYPVDDSAPVIHEKSELQEPDGPISNSCGAISWGHRIGKAPVAALELAHRSSVLPLLGMISMRTGRALNWDGERR